MKKTVLIILLAGVSTWALGQQQTQLSRSIDDNGHNLQIRVKGTIEGKEVDYNRSFDVTGLSKSDRETLAQRVMDSLGIANVKSPMLPVSPVVPEAEAQNVISGTDDEDSEDVTVETEDQIQELRKVPYSKEMKYDSNRQEVHLKYQFMKNGEEFVYEKSINSQDKSDKQLELIIRKFEQEIAFPTESQAIAL